MIKDNGGYALALFNGERTYVEGVVKLLSIGDETITLECKKAIVSISGNELKVDEIDDGSVTISGKIVQISSQWLGKK
jgi:hypothetical protein